MAKYCKRSDGLYVANRRINGKRKVFYGRTCKEVDNKIQEYLTTGEKGNKLKVVVDKWWEYLEKTSSANTPKTYNAGKNRLVNEFGELNVGDVTHQQLQGYVWDFASRGYAKGTVELEVSILHSFFKFAKRSGEIEVSPAADLEIPKGLVAGIRPALTEEQQKKVDGFQNGDMGLLGQILLYTGIRRGEMAALTWQDIDHKNGVIHITKKYNYADDHGVLEYHLKSDRGLRDIPIVANLKPLLEHDRIGLIFTNGKGEHLSKGQIRALWFDYCISCGLVDEDGVPNVVMHQLRHTYATMCLEAGVSIKSCAEWMGDTEEVVAKIYQEIRPKQRKVETAKLDSYIAREA